MPGSDHSRTRLGRCGRCGQRGRRGRDGHRHRFSATVGDVDNVHAPSCTRVSGNFCCNFSRDSDDLNGEVREVRQGSTVSTLRALRTSENDKVIHPDCESNERLWKVYEVCPFHELLWNILDCGRSLRTKAATKDLLAVAA